MGNGGLLPFFNQHCTILRIVVEMAQKTSFKAFLEAIGSQTMPMSGLVAYLDHFWAWWAAADFKRRGTIYALW